MKHWLLFFISFSSPCLKKPYYKWYTVSLNDIVNNVLHIDKNVLWLPCLWMWDWGEPRKVFKKFTGIHDTHNFEDPWCACLLYFLYIYFLFLFWYFYYIKEMPFNLWKNTFLALNTSIFFQTKTAVYWENSSCLIKRLHC